MRLVSPRETELLYEHPRPFAGVVDRERFDGALAAAAVAAGATRRLRRPGRGHRRRPGRRRGRGPGGRRAAWPARPPRSPCWPRASTSACRRSSVSRRRATSSRAPRSSAPFPGADTTTLFFGRDVAPGRLRLVGALRRGTGPDRPPDPQGPQGLPPPAPRPQLRRRPRRFRERAPSGPSPSPRACCRGPSATASWPSARRPARPRRRPAAASATAWPAPTWPPSAIVECFGPVVLRPGRPRAPTSAAGRPCSRRRS
ncbi:MAG: hypothetical protein MZV64_10785 [Ignavibacteriales bacterium]|nr:hypothetical protein [Ignavibacteriales bacterium]